MYETVITTFGMYNFIPSNKYNLLYFLLLENLCYQLNITVRIEARTLFG